MKTNPIAVLLAGALLAAGAAHAQTSFTGTGTGPIPDSPSGICPTAGGTPLDISFAVSGMTAPLTNISLSMTASHTWIGDLVATLSAPGGSPSFVIFGAVGLTTATGTGFASNMLNGPYVFENGGTDWWTVHSTNSTINAPAGTYCTTPLGGAGVTNPPGCTNLVAAFSGLTTPQINGTWTLRFVDRCGLDTGSVSAATLTLTGSLPLTSTPASGSTITLPTQVLGGPGTTATIQFQNPNAAAVTVTCTAPAAPQFTVSPLTINVPANGNASTTVTYSSAAQGSFTGTLSCSAGTQTFTFTLNGNTLAAATQVDALGRLAKLLMLLAVLGIGLVAVRRH